MAWERPPPQIGAWYQGSDGQTFEVVAWDEERELVEIQYFDGTIEELDGDTWQEEGFEPTEPPEDWSGSLDIERQDYGVDLESNDHLEWHNPLDDLDL